MEQKLKGADGVSVMVNATYRLDWVTRCPDIWSNTVLEISVRVFLDEFNI